MEREEMFDDPTGYNLTASDLNQEAYWENRRQQLLQEQAAGTIKPENLDEEGGIKGETEGLNRHIEVAEEQQALTPNIIHSSQQIDAKEQPYETGKQHKDIRNHPHYKPLKGHIPWEEGESNPNHPNYQAIYGDTPNWSWAEALLGPLAIGQADDKAELYFNRKHMFTAGSGTADFGTNIQEATNTVTKSAYNIVNDVLKLPEIYIGRPLSGKNPFDQRYGANTKWDPLGSIGLKEPWTGTRMGDVTSVIGEFAIPVGLVAKGLKGLAVAPKALKYAPKLAKTAGWINSQGVIQQAMIHEAIWMTASRHRFNEENVANLLEEHTFLGDWPIAKEAISLIAINEHDHPFVKQFKNTLEAAGMSGVVMKLFALLGDGYKALPVVQQRAAIKDMNEALKAVDNTELGRILNNLADQHDELGRAQLLQEANTIKVPNVNKGSRFRAAKNGPASEFSQGNLLSTNIPSKILRQLDALDNIGAGSVDPVITGRQSELFTKSPEFIEDFLKTKATELLGDPYVQGLLNDIDAQGLKFQDVFEPAFRRFQETIGGNTANLTPEQFWEPIIRGLKEGGDENLLENIVTADLINQSLFKEIRDLSNVGRELHKISDIFATDAITKPIAEKLAFGLTNVKRSRYLISDEYRRIPQAQRKAALAARTADLHDETIDGVRLMMQFLRNSESDELAQGILEVFSMSSKIKNFKDFDNWMRQKLRGGEFGDVTRQGVMTKELGAVMVNSILSSPKTPLRAIMGTAANAYLNEVSTLLGSTLRLPFTGDVAALRSAAASTHAMFDLIPDALKVFRANLDANFTGELATIKTRYTKYSRPDTNFRVLGEWVERNGTNGDKAAFYIANAAREANSNKLFTWSSRVMGATDDTFRWLLSKARSRKKAIEQVMSESGDHIEITPKMLEKIEDIEFKRLHNEDGVLDITKDAFLDKNFKEVTLTTELKGFTKGLDELMNRYPLTKPFFLFARTGINGLRMSVKNIPLVGAIVDESRAILGATPQALKEGSLLKYGIETLSDLKAAKSLILGRQAIGTLVTFGLVHKYMSGQMTGNGPAHASQRQMWIDSGWQPRSIKIGDAWVSYDSFEPFNLVMANIADIGDNLELMGEQFAEERFQLVVAALGKSVTSKTYLQGVNQLFDVLGGQGGGFKMNKIAANLANNQLPLAALRNDMGKLLNPNMRELGSNFWDHVNNRNPILKGALPIKYDMLNGRPIRDYNFFTRAFNAVSPIQLNMDKGAGRSFLFQSGYDMRLFAYTAPDGTRLHEHPKIRSLLQSRVGSYNLEAELNKLANDSSIQASLEKMKNDKLKGNFSLDPMKAYRHNIVLQRLFDRILDRAWADLRNHPEVIKLKEEARFSRASNRRSLSDTRTLLNIPK